MHKEKYTKSEMELKISLHPTDKRQEPDMHIPGPVRICKEPQLFQSDPTMTLCLCNLE